MLTGGERPVVVACEIGGAGFVGENVEGRVGWLGGEVVEEEGVVGVDWWEDGVEWDGEIRGDEGSGRRGGMGRMDWPGKDVEEDEV